jgi:protocatechuate 3,4-dioxygenase beta subunit
LSLAVISLATSLSRAAENGPPRRFTPPPGEETADIKSRIDAAGAALAAGKTAGDLLNDPALMSAHEWPRFRRLIREHAVPGKLSLVTSQEPGDKLLVKGRVLDAIAKPIPGALIYVYHTSARGWYSDRAAHVAAQEGDRKYARLFGYLTSARDGSFEIRTIRPGGYPDSNLPAHIHIEIQRPGKTGWWVSEIRLDDDPRLTAQMRQQSAREGFTICQVRRDGDRGWRVDPELCIR